MERDAMTVVCWTTALRQRTDTGVWAETGRTQQTKLHATRDGASTVCGFAVPDGAAVVTITPDWHEHVNCYNCAYRLWPEHGPAGYVRPRSGQDFPPRRECPHQPGQGREPEACAVCTPRAAGAATAATAVVLSPRQARDAGNPAPDVIRRWHIPCPYDHESCALCGEDVERGDLINIEYEAGVMHAACSDPPGIPQPREVPPAQAQDGKAGIAVSSDNDMVGPGAQETNAQNAVQRGEVAEAQVYALLALAAAVNRLAAAQEHLAGQG
jgi:hypothetical protein